MVRQYQYYRLPALLFLRTFGPDASQAKNYLGQNIRLRVKNIYVYIL